MQGQLTSLINSSNTNFQAIASQSSQLQSALTLLPGTLQQSAVTFNKLRGFGQASASSASRLLPWAHALAPALIAVRPLFRQTTPVIRNQLRPFSVAVQPVAKILAPAAAVLAQSGATPDKVRDQLTRMLLQEAPELAERLRNRSLLARVRMRSI